MIHLLWCTLRPQIFCQNHKNWMDKSKNPQNIKTKVCVNFKEHYDYIKQYSDLDIVISDKPERVGVCYPSYLISSDLNGEDEDIVVFASDDFTPPENWDQTLMDRLDGKNGILMVRDGYQLPDSSNMQFPCVTIPIMTFSALKRMNMVIYHPSYSHMYSDCELFLTAKEMGLLIDNRILDSTTFEHHHYAAGKRNADECDRHYHNKWKEDENTWNIRKNMSLEERLKV